MQLTKTEIQFGVKYFTFLTNQGVSIEVGVSSNGTIINGSVPIELATKLITEQLAS